MKILKVNYGDGSLEKNRGCEKAPDAILKQLKDVWSTEDGRKFDISKWAIEDSGIKNGMSFAEIESLLKSQKAEVFLGGDHSITYALMKSFSAQYKNPGLLVFDAHPECYEQFSFPTHGDWILHLIKNKIIPPENIVLVGVRASDIQELTVLKQFQIRTFFMKDLFNNHQYACDAIMEYVRKFDALHLSIDIDVLDPSCAPATGFPEPGGLTTREMIYYLSRIRKLKNLKQIDMVEVNPDKDINNITIKAAARLIAEALPEA